MKIRYAIILTLVALLIAACNFTLASDITPPPGYVAPTPMPTLGPLFPAQAPSIENGAAIYTEKCAPCHGVTGLGDGEQGKQLPVTVAAFALPETARKAIPAQWYTTVTQGNLDRFMPPFSSLDDQQRWDVISYVLTLHTAPEEIEQGKTLYEAKCASCHTDGFTQEVMAGLSAEKIVDITINGQGDSPAVPMSEDEAYAIADYMRTLTFASLQPAPTIAPVTETPVGALETPLEGTAQAEVPTEANVPTEGFGNIHGVIDNQSGTSLPSDMTVTLRGYEHGADPNAGPQEILSVEAPIQADGSYIFENMELPENRIFISEVIYEGITFQSQFAVVKADTKDVELSTIQLYGTTNDPSALTIEDVSLFFDFANETEVQVFAVYTMFNNSDKTIVIKMGDAQEVPFVKFPDGAKALGYEAMQDSANFVPTADGFALPPSETAYGLIAFASYPKDTKIEFSQGFVLPVTSVRVLLPEGVKASGDQLTDTGVQLIKDTNFQTYAAAHLEAGSKLTFTLTGKPKGTNTTSFDNRQTLLIGAGAFGLALILAGVWMYIRDRKRGEAEEEDNEDDVFDSREDIMDAIIALDDLHRAGKISAEAYQKRRAELKEALKVWNA